jgi:hypothetical protein
MHDSLVITSLKSVKTFDVRCDNPSQGVLRLAGDHYRRLWGCYDAVLWLIRCRPVCDKNFFAIIGDDWGHIFLMYRRCSWPVICQSQLQRLSTVCLGYPLWYAWLSWPHRAWGDGRSRAAGRSMWHLSCSNLKPTSERHEPQKNNRVRKSLTLVYHFLTTSTSFGLQLQPQHNIQCKLRAQQCLHNFIANVSANPSPFSKSPAPYLPRSRPTRYCTLSCEVNGIDEANS